MKANKLLEQHPELRSDQKKIEKIIEVFPAPDIPIDSSYTSKLQEQIKEKIQKKKSEDPKYFAFYLHNFRFYFSWFSVALGAFLILFVLGFFSFNKNPELLSNPKIINHTDPEAFWVIEKQEDWNTDKEGENKKVSLSSTSFVNPKIDSEYLMLWDIDPYPVLENQFNLVSTKPRYHIGEKAFPKIPSEMLIGKEFTEDQTMLQVLSKSLHLPEFSLNKLSKSTIKNFTFESPDGKYEFSINLETKSLSFFQVSGTEFISEEENVLALSEKTIKKEVKNQLLSFWIELVHYGDPKITIHEDSKEAVTLFYPKSIDGNAVRDEETAAQIGMTIRFDPAKHEIVSLYDFEFQPYIFSKYPIKKSTNDLLTSLEEQWTIDISKQGEKDSILMKKGEIIYLKRDDFLIPALLFQPKDTQREKNIFLSLF